MRILIAHNRYQARGGEDVVFEAETALLRDAGHVVETLIVSNDAINSFAARMAATLSATDNAQGRAAMTNAIDRFAPDIVHVHNFFPLLSPAVFDVCRSKRVPAVVTLHNYRTICAGGMLLRDGKICHTCLEHGHLWGVLHRCYRGSVAGSAASALMIARHQRRGTWTRPGLRVIALTRFARDIFVKAGFEGAQIDVKPNFMADPGAPDPTLRREGILYVGRLSREKGVDVLLRAVADINIPVRIAGDGPELAALKTMAPPHVRFLGALPREEVLRQMASACVVVVPSLWYEGFPMVVVEAFAQGTPVLASCIGGLAEVITKGENGDLVAPGDADALRAGILKLVTKHGDRALGRAARKTYLERYTPATNLNLLETIYARALTDGPSGDS